MQVSVNILTWNDLRYLPDLFKSLQSQTYTDVSIRILDNGSSDGTLEYLQQNHSQWLVARNSRNQGFAPGHNQLMKFALERWGDQDLSDKAVLWANADMIFHPHLIEELVKALKADPELGATQPKLLRAFTDVTLDEGGPRNVMSDVLDTTGLVMLRNWRMEDRGAGEVDRGQYDQKIDLIGPTGTCALLRASALRDTLINGEVFDGDFFAYREDCDFALRLRRAGWRTVFVPTALAHHYRGMYGAAGRNFWQRLKDRRKQRPFTAAMSTRNQIFFLIKNLTFGDVVRSGWRIAFNEAGRLAYGIFFEPQTRKLLFKSPGTYFRMLGKRKQVFAKFREPASVIRAYVS